MKLYRYRSMSSQGLARTFTDCELYFASPTQFKDPFDCQPPFSITNYTKDDLRCHFRKAFRAKCHEVGDAELESITENRVTSILQRGSLESEIAKPFRHTCFEVNSELGVLCLSELYDDILMWSHYAEGHRGIVLQFDKSGLESIFNWCERVDYENNIVTLHDININTENPNELAKLILLKKAGALQYEKEWRIIVDPGLRKDIPGCRTYKFPREVLTGVIFGCEIAPQDRDAVHVWLKAGNHQARIYQAIRESSSYSLKIDPPP